MSEHVRVESVEALQKFRSSLCKFAEIVTVGLDEAEADIRRTSFWITQEQHKYWKRQAEKRAELYARAKSDLNRKKMQKTSLGERCSYVDELKALAMAERRLEEARTKQANVRRWSRLLDQESFAYKGVALGMSQAVEVDVPNALAQLDNMVAALEAYASSAAPATTAVTSPTEEPASMARTTPGPLPVAADTCRRLRAQTPSDVVRDATPIAEARVSRENADVSGDDVRTVLAALDLRPTTVAADDKVVMACGAWTHHHIYLERAPAATAGDSGWYVGFADDTEVTGYEAARVADFLAGRPDLEAVLALPVGCLVVFAGVTLEAVLDAQDTLLWPPQTAPGTG